MTGGDARMVGGRREDPAEEALIDRSIDTTYNASTSLCAGAVIERGRTCSRRQFGAFLRRCLGGSDANSDDDEDEEDEEGFQDKEEGGEEGRDGPWESSSASASASSLPSRPWEALRLRVEHDIRCVRVGA